MNVALFYPWALLGAVAIAVPVWLHLHRRREVHLVRFSALRFLDDQPIARAVPLWPRDLFLLVMRVAALAAIVLAFAWPYVPAHQEAPLVTESIVAVFDNTLSHQAAGRWAESKRQLLNYVQNVSPGTQTAIVLVENTPRILKRFEEAVEDATARLHALSPGYGRGDYSTAVRLAGQLLDQSLGQSRRLLLYFDHQANQWSTVASATHFLADTRVDLPSRDKSPPLANLALWNGYARRFAAGEESTVQCALQLFRQGPASEATVAWSVNGTTQGSQIVPLDPQVRVINLAGEFPAPADAWVRLEVQLAGQPDALEGDNRFFLCLPPVYEGRAEAWAQTPYLRTALDPEVVRGRWQVRIIDTSRETVDDDQPLADVLVAELSQTASPTALRRLLNYRDSGRGILLVVDDLSPAAMSALHQWSINRASDTIVHSPNGAVHLLHAAHPLLEPFADGPLGDLTRIHVYRYYPLNAPGSAPLVFSSDGTPILWECAAKGKSYVLAFPLDRHATDLPVSPLFVPFLDWCMSTLRSAPEHVVRATPGESFRWTVPSEIAAQHVRVVGSGGQVIDAPVTNATALLTAPGEPGLFEIRCDSHPDPIAILEVNCPSPESELEYAPPDMIQSLCDSWVINRQKDFAVKTVDRSGVSEASIFSQHWWWRLLLAGVGALLVESSLLAWRKKP